VSAGGAALILDSDSERNVPAHYLALNSPPRWERCAVDAGLHRSSGLHWRSLRRRGGASERRLCRVTVTNTNPASSARLRAPGHHVGAHTWRCSVSTG
jgi:hypothetical protein